MVGMPKGGLVRARGRVRIPILALLSVSWCASVGAQTLHSTDAAEEAFRQGREAVKRGDYQAAYTSFSRSYEFDPTPGTMMNLADCEEHLGKLSKAFEHFAVATRNMSSADDRRALVASLMKKLDARLAHISVRPISGASNVTVMLDDTLYVQGLFTTQSPEAVESPTRVDPGPHTVSWKVWFPGGTVSRVSVKVDFPEGQTTVLEPGTEIEEDQRIDAAKIKQLAAPHEIPQWARPRASEAKESVEGSVQVRFQASPDDLWSVLDVGSNWYCSLPCDGVIDTRAVLQLHRANSFDLIPLSLAGNPPGSSLVVTPHRARSLLPGVLTIVSGVVLVVGGVLGDTAICGDCGGAAETAFVVTGAVGGAAIVAGIVLTIVDGLHVIPSAEVKVVKQPSGPPSPAHLSFGLEGLMGTF
jgi:hypothetical protein